MVGLNEKPRPGIIKVCGCERARCLSACHRRRFSLVVVRPWSAADWSKEKLVGGKERPPTHARDESLLLVATHPLVASSLLTTKHVIISQYVRFLFFCFFPLPPPPVGA